MVSKQNGAGIESIPAITSKVGRVAKGNHGTVGEFCSEFTALNDQARNLAVGGAIKRHRLVQKPIGESHHAVAPFGAVLAARQRPVFIADDICAVKCIVQ